ncbi:pyridoxamine 5'-phosphate oxidase family protein [Actinomadura sp. NPDC048394]|uniref:pyridoxamine 5'-phosphate oxidase family protein n=1 Tax=Actinomadura sp. NPDC048394 TaxID=3158223 RepID=UPI0033C7421A
MTEPAAEPPAGLHGVPLTSLTWQDALARVAANETYLLATSGPDARPHVVPVLGVWLDGAVCFNTGRETRKARDLASNAGCAVTVPGDDADLVIEGTAHLVRDPDHLRRVAELFPAKYPWWHPFVRDGEFYDPSDTGLESPRHVFAVTPDVVFAFGKKKGFTATRWRP